MDELERLDARLAFPGVGVQLAALERLRVALETQLEAARLSGIIELRLAHSVDPPHPDDAELDQYESETRNTHYLPKVFRGGFLLMLWAAAESSVKDITRYVAKEVGQSLPAKDLDLKRAEKELLRLIGLDLFRDASERNEVHQLREVRNTLVHHNGKVAELETKLGRLKGPRLEQIGLSVERDLHFEYFVPTEDFVKSQVRLVHSFLGRLDEEAFARLCQRKSTNA